MRSCSVWRLYVIIDRAAIGSRDLADVATAAVRGGADAIQLRDKTGCAGQIAQQARCLLAITRSAGVPLIVNDRADIAAAVGADGVHLGQDDLSLQDARRVLGPQALIGQSTHSLEQALMAEAAGANYIGFGPIFPTPTKPEYASVGLGLIAHVSHQVQVPMVCIGGIDERTLPQVLHAGAERVAVVRAVCVAADPECATRAIKHTVVQFVRAASGAPL